MAPTISSISSTTIHQQIALLTHNLVTITDTTGEFLMPLPDGRVIDTKGWNDWEWTHGIGLYGLYQYYSLTGDQPTLKIIQDWFRDRFAAGGTTKNINTMAAFLTLACLYEDEETREKTYLPWLDSWGEWAMYDLPRTRYGGMQHITYLETNHNQLWDDTLMMTVLPLAKIGLVLNRPHYVEEAKRQFLLHIKYLSDPTTGLWFHGWTFENSDSAGEGGGKGKVGHNFARARWARGNSWITIAIPEFLSLLDLSSCPLPPNDPIRTHLLSTLTAQCLALTQHQDAPTGLWRTLLDVDDSYLESSATAGFAYGMLLALRKRYLVGPEYEEVAVRAIKAVLGQIDEQGELRNTSFGTGMGGTLQFYKDIKRTSMPYGQAMAIMALGEFLRKYI